MAEAFLRPRLCLVVTSEVTVRAFLLDHLRALSEEFDVTVVTSASDEKTLLESCSNVRVVPLAMERGPSVGRDALSLFRLTQLLSEGGFDLVHSITPKAGLLTALAGGVLGVTPKIHTFTGQVWATRSGFVRRFLKCLDRIIVLTSHAVLADSESQARFLVAEGVARDSEISVLGKGSFTGVPLSRFAENQARRRAVREDLGIDEGQVAAVFLGRLKRDKGVLDLATAAADLVRVGALFHLVIAGPDEEGLTGEICRLAEPLGNRLHLVGFTPNPEEILAAGDILCLPSYREGFGSVVIEAAVSGVPALVSRIPGLIDAVEDGVTGLFHDAGDIPALKRGLGMLVGDSALRGRLGSGARKRAVAWFSREASIAEWRNYYRRVLACS
ncbi:MAG: glycosyltransferase [Acidobacteriota bacterium]